MGKLINPLRKSKPYRIIKRYGVRIFFCLIAALFAVTLLFRVVPVPFSAYMAQQSIGHLLTGDFKYDTKYQWVSLDKISRHIQLAVIAAEDQKFSSHFGFDWDAIRSAAEFNQKSERTRGGSTISQQTAKNLYLWHGQSWLRKAVETPITLLLEILWPKKRILEVYLNIAQFGEGVFGVEAASRHYFGKSAVQLNQSEAALLAAVLPNPLIYTVNRPSVYIRHRQQWIMRQMNLLGRDYLRKL